VLNKNEIRTFVLGLISVFVLPLTALADSGLQPTPQAADSNTAGKVKKTSVMRSCLPDGYDPNGGPLIGGFIKTTDGRPISGASVDILWSVKRSMVMFDGRKTSTDSSGFWQCRVSNEANNIIIRPAHPEYLAMQLDYNPAYSDLCALKSVSLMRPGIKVTGIVHDANGSPIANVLVMPEHSILHISSDTGPSDSPKTARTDAQGKFHLPAVEPGRQAIAFDAVGYAPAYLDVNVIDSMEKLDITLDRGITVRGQVVDVNGSPVANVKVKCDNWQMDDNISFKEFYILRRQALTGSNGQFSLFNMPAVGRAPVYFNTGHRYFTAALTADLQNHEPNIVILFPVQRITGTVLDDTTGLPVTQFETAGGFKWNTQDLARWDLVTGKVSSPEGSFSEIVDSFITYSKPAWLPFGFQQKATSPLKLRGLAFMRISNL
jgi:hypothetical protein